MSERPELKPCPMCAGKNISFDLDLGFLFCGGCGWAIDLLDGEDTAIERWNKISDMAADSARLDKLLGSGRLRFAVAIDYQVCLSTCRDGDGRYVIDEVLSHLDEQGNPAGDWWDNLPKAEEKTLWPKEQP